MLFHSSSVGDLRKTWVHWQPAWTPVLCSRALVPGRFVPWVCHTHYFRTRHLGMFYILGMAHRKLTLSSAFSLALGTLLL